MILCTSGTNNFDKERNMKKYTPAEIEIILANTCDLITASIEDDNVEGEGGNGEGGGWNDEGWM